MEKTTLIYSEHVFTSSISALLKLLLEKCQFAKPDQLLVIPTYLSGPLLSKERDLDINYIFCTFKNKTHVCAILIKKNQKVLIYEMI